MSKSNYTLLLFLITGLFVIDKLLWQVNALTETGANDFLSKLIKNSDVYQRGRHTFSSWDCANCEPMEELSVTMNEEGDAPIVSTTLGPVAGTRELLDDVQILAFRGIPFAQPPIGPLRFMPPVPASPWGDIPLNATKHGHPCVQALVLGNEDCLYIDFFVPENALMNNESLATIVYIHGGGFILGSGFGYQRPTPFLKHDVIVAILQYRLGVLGFFSTDDEVAPGNQGLQDQTLALQFVHDNIAAFGGDPNKVVVMGTSAGSVSAHLQMLAPSAQGLFQGAILHSGSALCPWGTGRDFNETAHALARDFLCHANTSQEIVDCLQNVDPHLLDDAMYLLFEWNFQPFKFGPRVDGVYIPDEPALLLMEGNFSKMPVIMSTVRNEGALESAELYLSTSVLDSLNENFATNGPISMMLFPDEDPFNTATKIYDHYVTAGNVTEEHSENLTRMLTDRLFHIPLDWTVQLMAEKVPVYFFELHHRGLVAYTNAYVELGVNVTGIDQWISHGDDVQYTFILHNMTDDADVVVQNYYAQLWTDFAKSLNPTPDESTLGFLWPESVVNEQERTFLKMTPTPTVESYYRSDTRAFWDTLPLRINDVLP